MRWYQSKVSMLFRYSISFLCILMQKRKSEEKWHDLGIQVTYPQKAKQSQRRKKTYCNH